MIIESFSRGTPTEGPSGTTVEGCSDCGEFVDAVSGQVSPLGEVLTQQSVGVFIRPSLPRTMWIAEVDRQARVDF